MVVSAPRSPAWAAPGTCGSNYYPHNMYYKNIDRGGVEGVTAAVDVRTSGLCNGGGDNFANAYTMLYCGELTGPESCSEGWGQVGYEKDLINPQHSSDDGITVTFAQVWRNSSDNETIYGTRHLTAGDNYHYKTIWVPNGCQTSSGFHYSCIIMYVDSTAVLSSDFDPHAVWPKMGMEYAEEAGYAQTDVPGTSDAPAAFSGMQYLNESLDWTDPDGTLLDYSNDSPTRWGHRGVTLGHRDLFTANP